MERIQRQFRDLRHIALHERACRVPDRARSARKSTATPPAVFAQDLRIAHTGERMIIGDEIKRFAFVLQRDRRLHHAEIIADVQDAAGLNAGKDAHGLEC